MLTALGVFVLFHNTPSPDGVVLENDEIVHRDFGWEEGVCTTIFVVVSRIILGHVVPFGWVLTHRYIPRGGAFYWSGGAVSYLLSVVYWSIAFCDSGLGGYCGGYIHDRAVRDRDCYSCLIVH